MGVFLSDTFLSIVRKPGQTDLLTVRARLPGDIERVFPGTVKDATRHQAYMNTWTAMNRVQR